MTNSVAARSLKLQLPLFHEARPCSTRRAGLVT
jgi:hypothetical protein